MKRPFTIPGLIAALATTTVALVAVGHPRGF